MMKKTLRMTAMAVVLLTTTVLAAGCGSATEKSKTSEAVEVAETTSTFTAKNEMYTVTVPGEWTESGDMGMSNFILLSNKKGMQAFIFGMKKGQILGTNGADVDSLEDFFDYTEDTIFNGPAMTTTLTETDGIELSNALSAGAKEGTATQTDGAKSQMLIICAETESSYYCFSFTFTKNDEERIAAIKKYLAFDESVVELEDISGALGWINASYAINIRLNGGDLNTVAGFEPDAGLAELMKAMLTRDWGVNNQAELYEKVEWLIKEGHNADAIDYLKTTDLAGDSREEVLINLKADGMDEDTLVPIMAAYDAKAAYGEQAISGWDYSRAMALLGWGYLADHLTYEDAMDKSLEVAQIIQNNFESWDDYFDSYFYGYSYWTEDSLEDSSSGAYQRYQLYKELKEEENGIFSVDFKGDLQKEW